MMAWAAEAEPPEAATSALSCFSEKVLKGHPWNSSAIRAREDDQRESRTRGKDEKKKKEKEMIKDELDPGFESLMIL